jgi:hypothetical protein
VAQPGICASSGEVRHVHMIRIAIRIKITRRARVSFAEYGERLLVLTPFADDAAMCGLMSVMEIDSACGLIP